MMRRFGHIIAVVVALMAAFACQRRPLETLEGATSRVIVKCLWEVSVYPEGVKPDGVSFYFFRNGVYYSSITTSSVDSCEVQLPVGRYKMYMINQSPEEYWRETFQNMTSFNAGYVNVNPYAREGEGFDAARLDAMPAEFETEFLRQIHFDADLQICIDGRTGRALIK